MRNNEEIDVIAHLSCHQKVKAFCHAQLPYSVNAYRSLASSLKCTPAAYYYNHSQVNDLAALFYISTPLNFRSSRAVSTESTLFFRTVHSQKEKSGVLIYAPGEEYLIFSLFYVSFVYLRYFIFPYTFANYVSSVQIR